MNKLIHDLNGDISTLVNALDIIKKKWSEEELENLDRMIALSAQKAFAIKENWAILKDRMNLKGMERDNE